MEEEQAMCREIEFIAGKEFICRLPFHGREFNNNGTQNPWKNPRGAPSRWRRHVFRKRYPIGNH